MMPADFRATHRATMWFADADHPYLLDLQRDGAFLYPPNSGRPLFHERFKPGAWHYIGGETLKRFERFDIAGLPGRRARSPDGPTTIEWTIRLAAGSVTMRLTEDERAQIRTAAGDEDEAEWARRLVGKRRLGPAKVRGLLLAQALK
jgi:hypothetical protein